VSKVDRVRIEALYIRPDAGEPPLSTDRLHLLAGHGIEGDCHNGALSPRHVLIAATGSYERLKIKPNELRENILLDCADLEWPSGTELQIGNTAALRVTFRCEPCGKLNKFRPGLSRDAYGDRGMLARIVRTGKIAPGDNIRLKPSVHSAMSDDWRERVLDVLERLPKGKWIEYRSLAHFAGLHVSYCRTFPTLIRARAAGLRLEPGRVGKPGAKNANLFEGASWSDQRLFDDVCEETTAVNAAKVRRRKQEEVV
jgi:alkylated DNA nucleotide flippase Atl1